MQVPNHLFLWLGKFLGSLEVPGPKDGSLWVPIGSLGPSVGPGWFPRFLGGSWRPQNHMFMCIGSCHGGPLLYPSQGDMGGLALLLYIYIYMPSWLAGHAFWGFLGPLRGLLLGFY